MKVIPPILADYDQWGMCSMYNLYVLGHYLLDLCQLVQWEEQRYGVSCSSDQLLSFFACKLYFAPRFCCWIYIAAHCCPNSFIAEGKAEKKSEDAFGCKAGWSGWIFWRHFHRSCYTTWDRGENRLMACQRKACCVQFFRNSEGQAGRLLGILSGRGNDKHLCTADFHTIPPTQDTTLGNPEPRSQISLIGWQIIDRLRTCCTWVCLASREHLEASWCPRHCRTQKSSTSSSNRSTPAEAINC